MKFAKLTAWKFNSYFAEHFHATVSEQRRKILNNTNKKTNKKIGGSEIYRRQSFETIYGVSRQVF